MKVTDSRQIRFAGHVTRKNQLEAIALTGMIEGKSRIDHVILHNVYIAVIILHNHYIVVI